MFTSLPTSAFSSVPYDPDAAAGVLRRAAALVLSETTPAPPTAPLSLYSALRTAAGANVDAFEGAALSLARVLGVQMSTNPSGERCLTLALALWSDQHKGERLTGSEAFGLIVQALAAL